MGIKVKAIAHIEQHVLQNTKFINTHTEGLANITFRLFIDDFSFSLQDQRQQFN